MAEQALRVLIIEDNSDDADLLRHQLESGTPSLQVAQISRLAAFREALASAVFDCVLLDLSLPDGRGLLTLAHARSLAPRLPIVVVTGTDDGALQADAMREGAQDYLIKDETTGAALVHAVVSAVERHRRSTAIEER